jgi:hypothetical protein
LRKLVAVFLVLGLCGVTITPELFYGMRENSFHQSNLVAHDIGPEPDMAPILLAHDIGPSPDSKSIVI